MLLYFESVLCFTYISVLVHGNANVDTHNISRRVAPYLWECAHGFHKDSAGICVPDCPKGCVDGDCVNGVCQCKPEYKYIELTGVCLPICTPDCENGVCVEPGKCECNAGYNTNDTLANRCEPTCSSPCLNARCRAPDVCECNPGYSFEKYSKTRCTVCKDCTFGNCTAPENCECFKGYEPVKDKNETICKPVCKATCGNGTCVAPDKCECVSGFEQKSLGQMCQALCSKGCTNGVCTEPELCKCNAGYKFDVNTTNSCSPVCSNGCDFGTCIGPENCQCLPGYSTATNTTTNLTRCQLDCQPTCKKGMCTVAELCLSQTGGFNGSKPCDSSCIKCINNTCLEFSESRYEMKTSDTNEKECEPICKPDCVNATCSSPGVCSCHEGYGFDKEKHICKPMCYGSYDCNNGVCRKPDLCVCDVGYKMNGDVRGCMPDCTMDCGNGTCIKPDTCHCDEGYNLGRNDMNATICVLARKEVSNFVKPDAPDGSSNKTVYITLSVLAVITVVAIASAVYWFKFRKSGSYSTEQAFHP